MGCGGSIPAAAPSANLASLDPDELSQANTKIATLQAELRSLRAAESGVDWAQRVDEAVKRAEVAEEAAAALRSKLKAAQDQVALLKEQRRVLKAELKEITAEDERRKSMQEKQASLLSPLKAPEHVNDQLASKVSNIVHRRPLARQSMMPTDPTEPDPSESSEPSESPGPLGARTVSLPEDLVLREDSNSFKVQLKLNDPPSVDEFDLLVPIGEGMSAMVWAGCHKKSETLVALKVLKKSSLPSGGKMYNYVKEEKRILQEMEHPFIIQLIAAFQDKLSLYMVLEYIPAGDFFSMLSDRAEGLHEGEGTAVTEDHAKVYSAELVMALGHLHKHGIVYRDLKPENVLMDAIGHLCLTDFGLSKSMGFGNTRMYSFVGTPDYLAPEVIVKQGHSAEVDWWGLGILICEMLAGVGNTPFYSDDDAQIFVNISSAKPNLPEGITPEMKSLLDGLLTKMVAVRLGSKSKGGTKGIQDHPWFNGIDWVDLAGYRRGDASSCNTSAPWTPTEDLGHDAVLTKLRDQAKAQQPSAQDSGYDGFDAYIAPEAKHTTLTASDLGGLGTQLILGLFNSTSEEELRDGLDMLITDDTTLVVNGRTYNGMEGAVDFYTLENEHLVNVECNITACTLDKAPFVGIQQIQVSYSLTATNKLLAKDLDTKGMAVVLVHEGSIRRALFSMSFSTAVNMPLMENSGFNPRFGTLQLQIDKVFTNLESLQTDVRSLLRSSVEDLFDENAKMHDPRYDEPKIGHDAIYHAFGNLVRMFDHRKYAVQGMQFFEHENGNQVILTSAIFTCVKRNDPRSIALFKKMLARFAGSYDAGMETKIRLPLVFRMEFRGLKCVVCDRVYRLPLLMRQLLGVHTEDLEGIATGDRGAFSEWFEDLEVYPNSKYFKDNETIRNERMSVANLVATIFNPKHDMQEAALEALSSVSGAMLPDVSLVDPITYIVERQLAILDDQPFLEKNTGGWQTSKTLKTSGRQHVCEGLRKMIQWSRRMFAPTMLSEGIETVVELDNATIVFNAKHQINEALFHQIFGQDKVIDPGPTQSQGVRTEVIVSFQHSTALINNIYVRRCQGSYLLQKIGLMKSGSMSTELFD